MCEVPGKGFGTFEGLLPVSFGIKLSEKRRNLAQRWGGKSVPGACRRAPLLIMSGGASAARAARSWDAERLFMEVNMISSNHGP